MANPIALAFVEVLPDLSRFRAALERDLAKQMAGVKVPPVKVAAQIGAQVGAQAGATAAELNASVAAGIAGQEALGNAVVDNARKTTAAENEKQRAFLRSAAVQQQLNSIETAGRAAASESAAAALRYARAKGTLTAATANLTAAEAAYLREATAATTVAVQNARGLHLQAVAAEEATLAELELSRAAKAASLSQQQQATASARAAAATAATQGQIAKGAAATALSFTGLRGAVLAAGAPFLAGAAAIALFAKALGQAAKTEETLNVFQETAGATAGQMERVSEAARQLGADVTLPGVSASDAAEAMLELSKAGLSVQDSISGARGVLQLATAAQIDNATASRLAANALNTFNLAGTETVHVADVLANAANAAQGEISDFGPGLAQAGAVAKQVGLSFEDTAAFLTLFAKNGLQGSDAGTSLRTALIRLIAPTKEAAKLIQSLGLQIRDANGNVRPDIFAQFGEATAALSPQVRDAAAALIFGQDAIRAVSIAADEGRGGLQRVQTAIAETGSAADLAEARTRGLSGALGELGSNLETAGGKVGGALVGPLARFTRGVSDFVTGVDVMISKLAELNDAEAESAANPPFANEERTQRLTAVFGKGIEIATLGVFGLTASLGDQESQARETEQAVSQYAQHVAEELSKLPKTDELPNLRLGLEGLTGGAVTGPIDQALAPVEAATQKLQSLGQVIPKALADARDKLTGALAIIASDPKQPISESVQKDVNDALAVLRSFGVQGQQILGEIGRTSAQALGDSLRSAVSDFSGIDISSDAIPQALRQQINQLASLGPAGRAQLRQVGNELSAGLAEGITDNDDAVVAARKQVADAIAAAAEETRDAIRSARGNLETLGSTLATQVAEIIDKASPAAVRLDELTKALERLQNQGERRNVRFDLSQAQQELEDMKATLAEIGSPNAEQQAAIDKTLAPFIEKVQDAKQAVKEADLTQQIDQQQKLKDQAAETAKEGIAKLVSQFEQGKINAAQFGQRLTLLVKGPLADLRKTPNLGLRFTEEFRNNLDTVLQQARDLSGFLGVPGTAPGAQSVNVTARARSAQDRVQSAQANLQQQLAKQTETASNTKEANRLLGLINQKLGQAPRGSRNPNTSGPDVPQKNVAGKVK